MPQSHRFVQYTPMRCVYSSAQSALKARKPGDEKLQSFVVAGSMKVSPRSSYEYRLRVTTRTNTHEKPERESNEVINSRLFERIV